MRISKWLSVVASGAFAMVAVGQTVTPAPVKTGKDEKVVVEGKQAVPTPVMESDSKTEHTVSLAGAKMTYEAIAGTITVGYSDSFDAMLGLDGKLLPDSGMNPPDANKPEEAPATSRMFYTAYFKKGCGWIRKWGHAAGNVSVQRRAGFGHDVAAHGFVCAAACADSGYAAQDRRAVHDGR